MMYYFRILETKITLNTQGRLILRENGKLIIPYEQFANAIMMKHLDGPHGLHLNPESTVRAVMESFTVGKESFGMEKEFILEMVQNCPNPSCRYYKSQNEFSRTINNVGSIYTKESGAGASTIVPLNFPRNSDRQVVSCLKKYPFFTLYFDLVFIVKLYLSLIKCALGSSAIWHHYRQEALRIVTKWVVHLSFNQLDGSYHRALLLKSRHTVLIFLYNTESLSSRIVHVTRSKYSNLTLKECKTH